MTKSSNADKQTKTPRTYRFKRVFIIAALVLFSWSVLQPLILSSIANAAATPVPASREEVERYEALRGLLNGRSQNSGSSYACRDYQVSGELPLEDEISADDYSNADYSPLVKYDSGGYDISKATFRVPATLFGDGTNEVTCKKALSLAYGGMFTSGNLAARRQEFIKKYYDTSSAPYKLKSGAKASAYSDVRTFMLSLISGRSDSFLWWRDRIISQAFNTCWKWGNPANPLTKDTPDSERYKPENWVTEQGGNKAGGYMVESAIEGRYDDGVVNCDGVKDYVLDDASHHYIMGFSEGDLQDKLDDATQAAELQARIDNTTGVLLTNPDGLRFCGVGFGMIPAGNPSIVDYLQYIATWLANGGTHPFKNVFNTEVTLKDGTKLAPNAQTSAEANPGATQTFIDFENCLKQAYPDLEAALNTHFAPPSADRVNTGGAQAEQKSCENNSGVLSWIVCSAVDLISGVFNWIDTQIQALLGVDREKYTSAEMYTAWVGFRNIAYAILVIMMLVMVISTAIGSGLFDAYTVKKALPRMFAAILFITFSWYITQVLIDLSNIVGNGVLGIMTSPFTQINGTSVTFGALFSGASAGAITGLGGTAALGIGVAIWAIPGAGGILLGYVGTGLLVITLAFLVLILRQMFILVLMLFAPLAILAWVFPGNDKLWKLWWSSFTKLLMMFPLIMALIGAGRIFSFVIADTDQGLIAFIIKFAAYVIPYGLIPLTFKFAGGAFASLSGMVNDRSKGGFDRLKKSRQKNYHKAGGNVLQRRANAAGWMQNQGSMEGRGAFGRRVFRTGGRVLGSGNVEAAMSARNAEEAKIINDQIATGRDDAIRGLTVNKAQADRLEMGEANAEGVRENALKRIEKDGTIKYKTLGGAWVSEAAVVEGHQRWGKNQFAQQAALSYEMRKASTDEEVAGISERYMDLATGEGGWGLSKRQATGNFTGAGFENQAQHIEFKHTKAVTDPVTGETRMELDAAGMAKEVFEKKGAYPLSQMSAHTIDQLTRAYDAPDTPPETKKHIEAIAEMFVQRGGALEGARDESGVPVEPTRAPAAATEGATGSTMAPRVYASGAASVNQAVNNLVRRTTQGAAPTDPYHPSQGSSPQSEL